MKTQVKKRTPTARTSTQRIFTLLLLLCFLLGINGALTVFPEGFAIGDMTIEETIIGAEFLSTEAVQNAGHVKRLNEQEPNLSTALFQNDDGTVTMYTFGYPIKYVDENGVTKDRSSTFVSLFARSTYGINYAYGVEENAFRTYFPKQMTDSNGVRLETAGHVISLAANGTPTAAGEVQTFAPENAVAYANVFGTNTLVQYTSTISGYREEIVLGAAPSNGTLEFTLNVGDLVATKAENGAVYLYTESENEIAEIGTNTSIGEKVGQFSPIMACDSAGHFSQDNTVTLQETANGIYALTIEIDENLLTDEQTAYPLVLTSSFVVDEGDNETPKPIEDMYMEKSGNTTYRRWDDIDLPVYYSTSDGNERRALIRFPCLTDSTNTQSNLTFLRNNVGKLQSAELWLYETTGNTATAWLYAYSYLSSWSEANGAVQTINSATFYNNGDQVGMRGVGNNAGYSSVGGTTAGSWYNFPFTAALYEWMSISPATTSGSPDKGIAICPYYGDTPPTGSVYYHFSDTEFDPSRVCMRITYSDYDYYGWRWLFDDLLTTNNISYGYRTQSCPTHYGIDLSENDEAIEGKAIKTPTNALVVEIGDDKNNSRGYYIILQTSIRDPYTEEYIRIVFMHMIEESPLTVGDIITTGTTVGNVGNTGLSGGPHLHVGIIRNGGTVAGSLNTLNPQRFWDESIFHSDSDFSDYRP